MEIELKGLCFRCEHRARYHETGGGPRCECQTAAIAVHSCYMYQPVKPVVLAPNGGDLRPQFAGAFISSRSHAVRIPKLVLRHQEYSDGNLIYWCPTDISTPTLKVVKKAKVVNL